jgi:dipeptidyl aminopeptidase/acylaminoacyl peptidase
MLGHTSRFRAFVSHAGVYDLRSMFGATEELWFPLWEFDGAPWENPEMYEKWSPSNFVERFQTPTLVVHGEKDYRVPVTQAMQLFSALQLRKVPAVRIRRMVLGGGRAEQAGCGHCHYGHHTAPARSCID